MYRRGDRRLFLATAAMSLPALRSHKDRRTTEDAAVSTPIVTEIRPRPEPVAHDPFIDDLRIRRP